MKDIVHLYTNVSSCFRNINENRMCSSGFEPWDPETPLPGTPPGEVHRVPPAPPPPPPDPRGGVPCCARVLAINYYFIFISHLVFSFFFFLTVFLIRSAGVVRGIKLHDRC